MANTKYYFRITKSGKCQYRENDGYLFHDWHTIDCDDWEILVFGGIGTNSNPKGPLKKTISGTAIQSIGQVPVDSPIPVFLDPTKLPPKDTDKKETEIDFINSGVILLAIAVSIFFAAAIFGKLKN